MDLRSLNYFAVVAQELNFTRAAEKLNMSQPPLSNQIKGLEEELGVTLFIRGSRTLTLTEAGKRLYLRTEQLLDLADRTREEITSLTQGLSGTLCLGTVEGKAPFLAADWIAGFHDEYPLVRYELINGSSDDVINMIIRGTAELGVIAAPYDEEHLAGLEVGSENWHALISSRNPLAQEPGSTIALRELAGQPLVVPHRKSRVDELREWFRSEDIEPQIVCEQSNYIDALAMATSDVGICIFPQTTPYAMPGVVSKEIVEPTKVARYLLVWKRNATLSELAQTFVDYVSDYLLEHPLPDEE